MIRYQLNFNTDQTLKKTYYCIVLKVYLNIVLGFILDYVSDVYIVYTVVYKNI